MASVRALELVEGPEGTRLRLRVKPGGRRNAVLGERAGALRVSVTAPPERGKANAAVVRLLAEVLDVAPSSIELLSGHGSPDKSVRVALDASRVRRRLADLLD